MCTFVRLSKFYNNIIFSFGYVMYIFLPFSVNCNLIILKFQKIRSPLSYSFHGNKQSKTHIYK